MNTKATPELSYFRLKLTAYLRDHQPDLVDDATFVSSRSDAALTAYCDAVAQGFSHPEAESIAGNVLFEGLHFSKYDTLVSVLETNLRQSFLVHFLRNSLPFSFAIRRCNASLPTTISRTTLQQVHSTKTSTPNSQER